MRESPGVIKRQSTATLPWNPSILLSTSGSFTSLVKASPGLRKAEVRRDMEVVPLGASVLGSAGSKTGIWEGDSAKVPTSCVPEV